MVVLIAAVVLVGAIVGWRLFVSRTAGAEGTLVFSAEPSPDDYVPQLFAIEADGTGLRQLTSDETLKTAMAWSPDGTRIAYTARKFDQDHPGNEANLTSIFTIDVDGTGRHRVCSACTRTLYSQLPGPNAIDPAGAADYAVPDSLAWSPDGTRLAAPALSNGVLIVDTSDGTTRLISTPDPVAAVAWSPDGTTVAASHTWFLAPSASHRPDGAAGGDALVRGAVNERPGGIYLIEVASGNIEEVVSTPGLAHLHGWTDDGQLIAYTRIAGRGKDAELAAYSVEERRSWPLVPGERGSADQGAAWSPDGDQVAALIDQFDEGHDPMMWITSPSGDDPKSVEACGFEGAVQDQCYVPGIAWSPGGDAIAYRASQYTPPTHAIVVQAIGSDARVLRLPGLWPDYVSGYCCLAWHEGPGG